MSTVQDTSSVGSQYGAGAAAASAASGSAADIQNRFLSLLVAQMKNQDPLNPLDNAQVTSQMAQLSTVQGITNMNTSLQALLASQGASQVSQAASLIGRAVLAPGNTVGPAQPQNVMSFDLSGAADDVTVSIKDASGNLVRKLDLGARKAGVGSAAWDGLAADGSAAPAGAYSFTVDAVQGGKAVSGATLILDTVNSVSQNSQGVQLNLAGSTSVAYADVRQVF